MDEMADNSTAKKRYIYIYIYISFLIWENEDAKLQAGHARAMREEANFRQLPKTAHGLFFFFWKLKARKQPAQAPWPLSVWPIISIFNSSIEILPFRRIMIFYQETRKKTITEDPK